MPELNQLLLQEIIKELHELNKTLTGIRVDLEEIESSISGLKKY